MTRSFHLFQISNALGISVVTRKAQPALSAGLLAIEDFYVIHLTMLEGWEQI